MLPQRMFEKRVCIRLHSENSEPTMMFSRTTSDEHPPDATALAMASSHHFTHPRQVSARFGTAYVMCCSPPPAWSSTPLRLSVCYPSISLVVNITCIRIFCTHSNVLFILDPTCIALWSGWSSTARHVVSPSSLSPSHPPTPAPSRWPALITLPLIAKFQLVWRRLCEALLSSLVKNTRICCLVYV